MPGLNRSLAIPQDEAGVYHCFNRCVQQAFLCGYDQEVARRWWEVCPERVEENGSAAEPKPVELAHWLNDPDMLHELRARLLNPSSLMRVWCSHIGRRANQETGKSGRCFEERFRSVRLRDEAALLACALYIDLNSIRARLAETPEQSEYASVHDRIAGRKQPMARALAQGLDLSALVQDGGLAFDVSCADPSDADAWLSQLTLNAEQRLNGHLAR